MVLPNWVSVKVNCMWLVTTFFQLLLRLKVGLHGWVLLSNNSFYSEKKKEKDKKIGNRWCMYDDMSTSLVPYLHPLCMAISKHLQRCHCMMKPSEQICTCQSTIPCLLTKLSFVVNMKSDNPT